MTSCDLVDSSRRFKTNLCTHLRDQAGREFECNTTFRNGGNHIALKIKRSYSVETQQKHTIIIISVWLHVSVFSRPSSGQYFPVEGTFGAPYTLWDRIMSTGCA